MAPGEESEQHATAFEPSFEVVLSRARQGEGRAFEKLYRALNRRVHAFARVRKAADPEGMVNDVFLQAFTALPRFDGTEAQFTAWIFAIARNRLVDEIRRRDRRVIEIAADHELAGRPDRVDVAADAIDYGIDPELQAHLDALTPDQRDVLLLRVVADLSVESVAEAVGKPPGAVKALQRRAIRTIARRMSSEAVSP